MAKFRRKLATLKISEHSLPYCAKSEGFSRHGCPQRDLLFIFPGLIKNTNSCEFLLLAAAALTNISFIEHHAVFILVELNTVSLLLIAVRKLGARASIFLQEQVATLIANMAAVSEARSYLTQHRAVGALLCFLQVKHSPVQSNAEHAAVERLQHKSAVAMSR